MNLGTIVIQVCCAMLLSTLSPGEAVVEQNGECPEQKTIHVQPASSAPKIDGVLDDPCWESAGSATGFITLEPYEGRPNSEETVVRVTYDARNLYVAFECLDSQPEAIRARYCARDHVFQDDWVGFALDTYNDRRRAYEFILNPLGMQADAIMVEGVTEDFSWDTVFESEGRVHDEGYSVEVAIPLKSIRFPSTSPQVWGVNFYRSLKRLEEKSFWSPISRDVVGWLRQCGTMTGLEGISPGRHVDLIVYSTVGQDGGLRDPDDPAPPWDDHPAQYRTGADLKWGILSNITLDLTVNPDFSQVESDAEQIDINNRFPLFFSEKRPFFLEGSDMFETGFRTVHTRRLADPLAAAKLTGKTGSTTFALISAYDRGVAREDTAMYTILRTRTDVLANSWVGLMVVDREQENGYNRVAGVDGQFRLGDNYQGSFQAVETWTDDGEERYSDPAYRMNLGRFDRHFNTELWFTDIRPNTEFQSGYLSRTDIWGPGGWMGYTFRPEGDFLVWWEPAAWVDLTYDHSGQLIEAWGGPELNMQLRGPTWISLEFNRGRLVYRDSLYRPYGVEFSIENDSSGRICGGGWFWVGRGVYFDLDDDDIDESFLGYCQNGGLWCTLRPTDRLKVETSIERDNMLLEWGGDEIYDEWVGRAKATYQFNREFAFRGVLQENSHDETLAMQLLFSYVYVPGSVFYLGLNEEYDHGSSIERNERTVFAKVSYLWRL